MELRDISVTWGKSDVSVTYGQETLVALKVQ